MASCSIVATKWFSPWTAIICICKGEPGAGHCDGSFYFLSIPPRKGFSYRHCQGKSEGLPPFVSKSTKNRSKGVQQQNGT